MPAKKAPPQEERKLVVRPMQIETLTVPIVGIRPLIVNPWTEKARDQMADAQGVGKEESAPKRTKKAPKDPDAEYEARLSAYRLPSGANGFPAAAFKAGMVRTAQLDFDIPMTVGRTMFFVTGTEVPDYVTIEGEPKLFEAFPRNANGNPDLRYRPIFYDWASTIIIEYDAETCDATTVVNLLNRAGWKQGIGDWRPGSKSSNTGQYGMFKVVTT